MITTVAIAALAIFVVLILVHQAKHYAEYAEEQIRLAETWMNESLREKAKALAIREQAEAALANAVRVANKSFKD